MLARPLGSGCGPKPLDSKAFNLRTPLLVRYGGYALLLLFNHGLRRVDIGNIRQWLAQIL